MRMAAHAHYEAAATDVAPLTVHFRPGAGSNGVLF